MTDSTKQDFRKDTINIKSDQTIVICRCGQSQKFPFCDGTHRNIDAVIGPAIIKHSDD